MPVVGSLIPGISDIVQDGKSGFLVPPRDSEALAAKISKLLEDGDTREAFSKNAPESVSLNNSWSRILDELDNVYATAVQHHRKLHVSTNRRAFS